MCRCRQCPSSNFSPKSAQWHETFCVREKCVCSREREPVTVGMCVRVAPACVHADTCVHMLTMVHLWGCAFEDRPPHQSPSVAQNVVAQATPTPAAHFIFADAHPSYLDVAQVASRSCRFSQLLSVRRSSAGSRRPLGSYRPSSDQHHKSMSWSIPTCPCLLARYRRDPSKSGPVPLPQRISQGIRAT